MSGKSLVSAASRELPSRRALSLQKSFTRVHSLHWPQRGAPSFAQSAGACGFRVHPTRLAGAASIRTAARWRHAEVGEARNPAVAVGGGKGRAARRPGSVLQRPDGGRSVPPAGVNRVARPTGGRRPR